MELVPIPNYRYAFKRGMVGTDVAALQINLGVTVDGDFGGQTEKAVKSFQELRGVTVDGIAGSETQRTLCRVNSGPIQKEFKLPGGSLISIANNESGFAVAAYAPHSHEGYDLGAFQRSLTSPSQGEIRDAYDLSVQARRTGKILRETHDRFANPWPVDSWYVQNIANGNRGRMAWQLAFLTHNWPEGAENIWKRGSIHTDPSVDTEDSDWVIYFSGGRLRSDRDWVRSYIERSTVYVQWPQ